MTTKESQNGSNIKLPEHVFDPSVTPPRPVQASLSGPSAR